MALKSTSMKNLVFLCTGNTCRSIMAEAIARQRGAGRWRVHSAGVEPEGVVNAQALEVLGRHGVPVEDLHSKGIAALGSLRPDVVVTVCNHAARTCPTSLAAGQVLHRPMPDPSKVPPDEREQAFEQAYRTICALVDELQAI